MTSTLNEFERLQPPCQILEDVFVLYLNLVVEP